MAGRDLDHGHHSFAHRRFHLDHAQLADSLAPAIGGLPQLYKPRITTLDHVKRSSIKQPEHHTGCVRRVDTVSALGMVPIIRQRFTLVPVDSGYDVSDHKPCFTANSHNQLCCPSSSIGGGIPRLGG